ncbi:DNA-directed RNA polymerase subunit E'' [Candidatus Woesearchaeota archaeon]|nr:DNA-directed RNA polymerase subunit E'' [Candidatus Woesearchaeota archaeon]
MEEKVCKNCKAFYTGDKCPVCGSTSVASAWYGKLIVLNASKSVIAKMLGITTNAAFALKVR